MTYTKEPNKYELNRKYKYFIISSQAEYLSRNRCYRMIKDGNVEVVNMILF